MDDMRFQELMNWAMTVGTDTPGCSGVPMQTNDVDVLLERLPQDMDGKAVLLLVLEDNPEKRTMEAKLILQCDPEAEPMMKLTALVMKHATQMFLSGLNEASGESAPKEVMSDFLMMTDRLYDQWKHGQLNKENGQPMAGQVDVTDPILVVGGGL